MPIKPDQNTLDAARASLNPREVLEVVINETPTLRSALQAANLKDEKGNPLIEFFDD